MSEQDSRITNIVGTNVFKKVWAELAEIVAPAYDIDQYERVLNLYKELPQLALEDITGAAKDRGDKIQEVEASVNLETNLQGKHGEVRRYPDRIEAIYDTGQKFIVVPQLVTPSVSGQELTSVPQEPKALPIIKGFQVITKDAGDHDKELENSPFLKKAA